MGSIAAAFEHRGTAICANGALAYDMRTEAIEALHLIPPPVAGKPRPRALRAAVPGIGMAVEYPDGYAADRCYEAVNPELDAILPRVDDESLFARPASKLLGRHFGYSCDDLLALAEPAVGDLVAITHSNGRGLVEAAALGVSKASVVAELAAGYGIGRESVIAFGDMPNDLPLLELGWHLLRGANAHPDVTRRRHAASSAPTTTTAWPSTWKSCTRDRQFGPKRSVLILSAGYPASVSRAAAASTKPDGPQAKTAGASSGGNAVLASTSALSGRRSRERSADRGPPRPPPRGRAARPAGRRDERRRPPG